MTKFYSYPGKKNNDNTGSGKPTVKALADANPNWAEWRKNRDANPLTTIGMDVGEYCRNDGEVAKLLHEEYNPRENTITQVLQRSSAVGSGTIEATWVPQSEGQKATKLTRTRTIHS